VLPPFPLHRGALLVAAVVFIFEAGPAAGAAAGEPDPQRKAAASAHLKRGAELIDAENLKGALAEFEAAYALVPSPSILHNFGIVYQGLGQKAAALEAFQRFLDEAVKSPPATREHAEQAVQALRGQVAELTIACDVAGAAIVVDGRKVGETPQQRPIHLDPGRHELFVRKGNLDVQAQLDVSPGQQLTIPARLAAPPAAPAAEVKESVAPSKERPWQRPAAWTTAVAGGVAAGVFATTLVVRHFRVKEFNDQHCGTEDPGQGGPHCKGLWQRGKDAERWALVSGVTAGALGIGAAVLFLTLPEKGPQVSLRASPSHLGLGLQGRF
jgi:PEGA domain-containing protein